MPRLTPARPMVAVLAAVLLASGCTVSTSGQAAVPGPSAPLSAAGPVLLIPGYGGGGNFLKAAADQLRARGKVVQLIDIDDGTGDLRQYADRVLAEAQRLVESGAPSVDIVGFSAGGVIARIAATTAVGQPIIRRVATVGSPHHGTRLSSLGQAFGQCPTACEQLAPESELLELLPEASSAERYLTLWSQSDDVVRPPESARLAGATELLLQSVCDEVVGHIALMGHPVTTATVVAFLDGASLPSTCATP